MQQLSVGQALGRYELLMPIGVGGMAQVWAARLHGTRGFQKIVAIKTIVADSLDGPRLEQMFLEEATLASQIHHPNVVGTLELGEHEGMLYLVMEWVHGESLGTISQRAQEAGGMPLSVAVNVIGQVCKGLHAAHELRDESGALLGVVHRDISAQNVLVTYTGTAKLVDFGIAKVTARSSSLTEQGEIKGKFAYMSPEQVLSTPVDRRADIFAMGVLLYVLTTGQHPFKGENPAATIQNICAKQPPLPPSKHVSGYPRALEKVVLRALAKSPDDRYATAHELLNALEAALPEAFEASFEAELADYLKTTFPTRPAERMAELKRAQQLADVARGEAPSSSTSSVGSLRAVLVDQNGTLTKGPTSSRTVISVTPEAPTQPSSADVRTRRRMGSTIAALAVFAVVAFGLGRLGRVPSPDSENRAKTAPASGALAPTAFASPAPATEPAPRARTQHPGAEGVPAKANDAAGADTNDAPRVEASRASTTGRAKAASRSIRGAHSVPASVASTGAVSTAPPVAATPDATRPTPNANSKFNAWDDKNYGGRR